MSFHGDEDWLDMNGLLTNENTEIVSNEKED